MNSGTLDAIMIYPLSILLSDYLLFEQWSSLSPYTQCVSLAQKKDTMCSCCKEYESQGLQ